MFVRVLNMTLEIAALTSVSWQILTDILFDLIITFDTSIAVAKYLKIL